MKSLTHSLKTISPSYSKRRSPMRERKLYPHEAIDAIKSSPVNFDEATEILIELIDPTGARIREARFTLLDKSGSRVEILNRNMSYPLILRATVRQTQWPSGEIVNA